MMEIELDSETLVFNSTVTRLKPERIYSKIYLAQNSDRWRALVDTVVNIRVPYILYTAGNLLTNIHGLLLKDSVSCS
jgi:hypothetical protein